jgi:hypothetical protein
LRLEVWLCNRLHAISRAGEQSRQLRSVSGWRAFVPLGVQAAAYERCASLRFEYRPRWPRGARFSCRSFAAVA